MIILSDALNVKTDEGCLKVANSLVKRIKNRHQNTLVVSYGDSKNNPCIDEKLKLNKLFLNSSLFSLIKKKKESVLYIPFSSNTFFSVIRTLVLSLLTNQNVKVAFVLRHPMNGVTKQILKLSRAEVIVFSKESYNYFRGFNVKTTYIKTGVDTKTFIPVKDDAEKTRLREKYHLPVDKKIVLHVGHLTKERNVEQLLKIKDDYHVLLVVSYVSDDMEQAKIMKKKILERPNTTIIDDYIENIEEIYQMADVYFFPTTDVEGCIDVPLSVMEAASCDLPIVTTCYGEIKEFYGKKGFYFIDTLTDKYINSSLEQSMSECACENRSAVLEYDWERAVSFLVEN